MTRRRLFSLMLWCAALLGIRLPGSRKKPTEHGIRQVTTGVVG